MIYNLCIYYLTTMISNARKHELLLKFYNERMEKSGGNVEMTDEEIEYGFILERL